MGLSAFNRARRLAAEKAAHVKEPKDLTFNELRLMAKKYGVEGYGKMNKDQLLRAIKGMEGEGNAPEDEAAVGDSPE